MWQDLNRRALLAGLLALAVPTPVLGGAEQRVSGPHTHANLSLYFIHGPSATGPVPMTLEEAMGDGLVVVHETGEVSELMIENRSDREVFVQSGDIVKGGNQDRVLAVSLVLPARSGRMSIGAYCVEQGRWAARGNEDQSTFSMSNRSVPSSKLKLAIRAAELSALATGSTGERDQGQSEVWREVAAMQEKLSRNVGEQVAAKQSASSLQLSLENDALRKTETAHFEALLPAGGSAEDIVGLVVSINGKLNSSDIYPSNGLFMKMWPKLLRAAITEAIADRQADVRSTVSVADVEAFLAHARRTPIETDSLDFGLRYQSSEVDGVYTFATKRLDGSLVHMNHIVRE